MLKKMAILGLVTLLLTAQIVSFGIASTTESTSFARGETARAVRAQPTANFTYLIADGTSFIGSTAFRVDDGNLDIFIEAFPASGTQWDPATVTKADIIIQEYHGHVTHYDADTVAMVISNTGAYIVGNAQVKNDMLARSIAPSQIIELSPTLGGSVSQTVLGVKITSYGMIHTGYTSLQVDTYLVELPNGITFFHGTCASASSASTYMVGNPEFYGLNGMILDYEHDFTTINSTFDPDILVKVHDFNNNGLGTLWDDHPFGEQTLYHNTTYNYVLPESLPELYAALLDPTTGDNETDYEFSVKYKYIPNIPPTKGQVILDSTPYDMNAQASSGWNTGVDFTYVTKLTGGTHQYHFEFEVDSKIVRLPETGDFTGPEVNSLPILSNAGFTPDNGDTVTEFTFSIVYTDADDVTPTQKKLVIDEQMYNMETQDTTFADGAAYTYITTLEIGAHTYYYLFNDGIVEVRVPVSGELEGPNVVRSNSAPVLSAWEVSPTTGHRNDEFTFSVRYLDNDNDEPTQSSIYLDGNEYSMIGSSTLYSYGVIFFYTTYLDLGTRYYHFEFNDSRVNVRAPADLAEEFEGPVVNNRAPIAVLTEPSDGDTFTTDDIVTFDASSSSDPDGDYLTYTIHSDVDGLIGTEEIVKTNLSEGDHTITLTVTDKFNSSSFKIVNIEVIQLEPDLSKIEITLDPAKPEEGHTVTVEATISNTGDAPAYDVEITISIDDSSISEDTILEIDDMDTYTLTTTFTATAGNHELKVAILNGIDKTVEFTVPERTKPSADAGVDLTANTNEELRFDGVSSNSTGTIVTYFWDFDDGTNATGKIVMHTYDKKGTYKVKLTVTDELGKKDTDTITVTVFTARTASSKDSGMDITYLAIILVIIVVVVVLVVLFTLLKRKKSKGTEGEFIGQVPTPRPDLPYIAPPEGVAPQPQQPQLGYIQPLPDYTTQQPQMGYIQPPPGLEVTAPQQFPLAQEPPTQPSQLDYIPYLPEQLIQPQETDYLTPPGQESIGDAQFDESAGEAAGSSEDITDYLPQSSEEPQPQKDETLAQPPQENTIEPPEKVPKIVPKIKPKA